MTIKQTAWLLLFAGTAIMASACIYGVISLAAAFPVLFDGLARAAVTLFVVLAVLYFILDLTSDDIHRA